MPTRATSTKKAETRSAGHQRNSTAARRNTSDQAKSGKAVNVWGEVSITVAITDDPPQFIKVTFGHERVAPSDDDETISRYERRIHRKNEEVVERRAEQLKRLVERIQT